MSYDSEVKRILKMFENEKQNSFDAQKLQKINYIQRAEHSRKVVMTLHLTKAFNPQTQTVKPGGFVNPIVTITSGIPSMTIPSVVLPILLDFAVAGLPVTIPNMNLVGVVALLLVASSNSDVPVPGTEEDAANLDVQVQPNSTGTPVKNPAGSPIFISPNATLIPISGDSYAQNTGLTINIADYLGNMTQLIFTVPDNSPTVDLSLNPPLVNNTGSSAVDAPLSTTGNLNPSNTTGNIQFQPQTFKFTPQQINMPAMVPTFNFGV